MFSEVFLFLIHAKKTPCIPEDILHQCVSCILRLWSSCVREFHILSVVKISRYMLLWDKKTKLRESKTILSREVNLTDDVDAQLYVTKVSTISLYLRKLFVTWSLAIASSVKYSEIRQNFSKSESVGTRIIKCQGCQHI